MHTNNRKSQNLMQNKYLRTWDLTSNDNVNHLGIWFKKPTQHSGFRITIVSKRFDRKFNCNSNCYICRLIPYRLMTLSNYQSKRHLQNFSCQLNLSCKVLSETKISYHDSCTFQQPYIYSKPTNNLIFTQNQFAGINNYIKQLILIFIKATI